MKTGSLKTEETVSKDSSVESKGLLVVSVPTGGHYIAYARNALSGTWYAFDDHVVSTKEPRSEDNRDVYILFYQRKDCNYDMKLPQAVAKLAHPPAQTLLPTPPPLPFQDNYEERLHASTPVQ